MTTPFTLERICLGNTFLAGPTGGTFGSSGTEIILTTGSATSTPYAIGVNTNMMWYGVPSGASHVFYGGSSGTTALARIGPTGTFTCVGDVIAFGNVSDRKYKTDIHGISSSDALKVINSLQPVNYKWMSTVFNESKRGTSDSGFIAQDIEEIIPIAVNENEMSGEQYKYIKYEKLLPYIVGAIQELSKKINNSS